MRKILWVTIVGGGLGLIGVSLLAGAPPKAEYPNNVRDFMQLKLKHSQQLLEGIVLEDFDRVAKHAQELSLLSQAATWQVLQTPDYLQHSVEFRRAADAVMEAAKKKNVDGAALSYLEMTMKCVNCHKYVRSVRTTGLDAPDVY